MKTTRIGLVLFYAAGLAGSLWLGYQVRFNFAVPVDTELTFPLVFAWLIGFKLFCLWRFRQFDAYLGCFSLADFSRLSWVLLATSFFVFAVSEFAERRDLGLQAVAFFDDDRMKWGKHVHDVPVVGAPEILLGGKMDLELEEVIIAMPSAPAKRVAEIVEMLNRLQIKFSTVPSFYELTTGQAKVSQLRAVEAQDLLGREQVRLATEDIRYLLRDRIVMVTGAGGSIGSELCRQIASYLPRLLLLVEQSEVQLFQIEQELIDSGWGDLIVPLAANVQDESRLEQIFRRYDPDTVFHAAAHKHVPLMETQPGEAIKNNALGTLRLAETCLRHHTDRFVLISSDKAINPTSVMGATKRLAEMCVQSLHAGNPGGTRFMAVRFGNVLGSSGSVLPIFNKQIAAGGPIKVTHPDMRRYFMTIPEAVGLVLQSAALGSGGEIFMLDMGKPVKIVDLARQLIKLSGFVPDQDIRIEFTGLRPGEKLFEELSYAGERITATRHPKITRLLCDPPFYGWVRGFNQFTALATDQVATRRESETLDERNGGQPGPKVEIQDTVHWDEGVVAAK